LKKNLKKQAASMSNIERIENVRQLVMMAEPDFNKLAKIHNAVTFQQEAMYALRALADNEYLAKIAMGNQDSLRRAVIDVAAVGLSLNPVHRHAYLLPRKNKVCLDISYLGYIQLAVDVGAIKWCKADIVREGEEFIINGFDKAPTHNRNPFAPDAVVVGAYCVAKTHDGDFLTEVMSVDEIFSIRDKSEAFKQKSGPWVTHETEMMKKTVIRRAYKSWPKTDTRRLEAAIDAINEADPIDLSLPEPPQVGHREESFIEIREVLKALGKTEEQYIAYAKKTYREKIERLEDFTDTEINMATIMLNSMLDSRNKAKGKTNATAG
jgi:phage RecT family recombinase